MLKQLLASSNYFDLVVTRELNKRIWSLSRLQPSRNIQPMQSDLTGSIHDTKVFQWLGKTYHTATAAFERSTNITAARWRLLFLIERQKACTQKFLIAQVRVDPGSITRQLKLLESEGLIHREDDPNDNRLTLVSLSLAGDKLVKEVYSKRAAFLERMLDGIPEKDVQVLIRSLERMAQNLGDTQPLP